MSKIQPFSWYGSKYNWLDFILPKLPRTKRFVEPFGGSAAVLLNREPSSIEVYNDWNEGVYNFFKVLRERPEKLVELLEETPYHEKEYGECNLEENGIGEMEKARRFFVRSTQSFNSDQTGGWSYTTSNPRGGKSMNLSRYEHKIENLAKVSERLKRVQFFNRDGVEIIETFDFDDCTIYVDPPYPHESRSSDSNYEIEMDDSKHEELHRALTEVDAYVALSSYRNPLYDELYSEWFMYEKKKKTASTNQDAERTEVLYTNYDVDEIPKDYNGGSLFDY